MPNPIILTKADAYPKIKAAYDAHALQAQVPSITRSSYRDPSTGCACAIGQLVPKHVDVPHKMFASLVAEGFFIADDPEWFQRLQIHHDAWQAGKPGAEQRFVRLLDQAAPHIQ